MISLLNIELLCEMERREREAAFANKHNPMIQYYDGGSIQTSKIIALLKKMRREKHTQETALTSTGASNFSSRTLVVKKVHKNE